MYVLEMRSTANYEDCRYRSYTSSERKAEAFKAVPRIPFTDSGHGIVPYVHEHSGPRLPLITVLADHVRAGMPAKPPRKRSARLDAGELLTALNGLVGLVQLVRSRPDCPVEIKQALTDHYRLDDAFAAIEKASRP